MRHVRRPLGRPRQPGSGPYAESAERGGERHRTLDGTRSGLQRVRPRASPRGACGQNLHKERRGDLFSSHPHEASWRKYPVWAHPRRSYTRRQVLLRHPDRRHHLGDVPDLLRDTRPTRRTANRRRGLGLALGHGARRPHRSRTRDSRRPPCLPVGDSCFAGKGAGAAYVGSRIAGYLRPLLDTGPARRRLRRNSGPRRDFRSLSRGSSHLATTSSISLSNRRLNVLAGHRSCPTMREALYAPLARPGWECS